MNNNLDINDLFDAARRHNADLKRQQKLGDMIDQLALENGKRRRRPLWIYSSVAAAVLLLVTFGLRILYGGAEENGTPVVVAESQPVHSVVVTDSASSNNQVPVEFAPACVTPNRNATLAVTATSPQPIELPAEILTEPEVLPVLQNEVPLLVEDAVTMPPDTPQVAATQHRVFERTSSRLVCGGGCAPNRSQTDARGIDTPQLAFINNSGTGTNFEIGSIPF